MSQQYVIETQEQYPKKCVFEVYGQDKIGQYNLQVGGSYTVSFDIDAREYNGKWYNSLRAWGVISLDASKTQAPVQQPQAAPSQPDVTPFPDPDTVMEGSGGEENLPF